MKAMRCDRCGRFYTINDYLPPYLPTITPEFRSGVSIDLCSECVESFNAWLYTEFYFREQVKMGHGVPLSAQLCYRCKYWGEENGVRKCTIGRPERISDKYCDKWEPKEGEQE